MDPNVIINRLVRLAKLDTTVFDEVRDDAQELVPSLIVLVVSALLGGLGMFLFWTVVADIEPDSAFLNHVVLGALFFAGMYAVAVLVVYVVMAQFFKTSADVQVLMRTMFYASAPFALSLFMFIPFLWPVFAIVPLALMFVMMIYAVQSATAADSTQVVMATTIGFAVMVLILGFIAVQNSAGDAPLGAGLFGTLQDYTF